MANNIAIGPNILTSKVADTFSGLGFNSTNTNLITTSINGVYLNWKPGRSNNGITSTAIGQGYIIDSKVVADRSNQFTPTFPAGSGGESPVITLS